MRILALMAFFALQLTVYTCGFDIHVHAMDAEAGHIAEHLHDKNDEHKEGSESHACHMHASHTFAIYDVEQLENNFVAATTQLFVLADLNLKDLPFLIEHPPKLLHS